MNIKFTNGKQLLFISGSKIVASVGTVRFCVNGDCMLHRTVLKTIGYKLNECRDFVSSFDVFTMSVTARRKMSTSALCVSGIHCITLKSTHWAI